MATSDYPSAVGLYDLYFDATFDEVIQFFVDFADDTARFYLDRAEWDADQAIWAGGPR